MPKWLLAALVGAALAGATIVAGACSSGYDGPHSTECSNGPPYDLQNYPPFGNSTSSEERMLPECVPRCGAEQKYTGRYAIAALPSGRCAYDSERCTMGASNVVTCNGLTRACDLSGFECVCAEGAWRCYVTFPGSGVCGQCIELDAATSDARLDGDL
jgi:hypothetical protein